MFQSLGRPSETVIWRKNNSKQGNSTRSFSSVDEWISNKDALYQTEVLDSFYEATNLGFRVFLLTIKGLPCIPTFERGNLPIVLYCERKPINSFHVLFLSRLILCKWLRWLTTVFPRLSSACYDSKPHVSICRVKMTQVTSTIIKNHFSTWKASNLFGICSDTFKRRSNMYSSLGAKNMAKKVW